MVTKWSQCSCPPSQKCQLGFWIISNDGPVWEALDATVHTHNMAHNLHFGLQNKEQTVDGPAQVWTINPKGLTKFTFTVSSLQASPYGATTPNHLASDSTFSWLVFLCILSQAWQLCSKCPRHHTYITSPPLFSTGSPRRPGVSSFLFPCQSSSSCTGLTEGQPNSPVSGPVYSTFWQQHLRWRLFHSKTLAIPGFPHRGGRRKHWQFGQ